MFLDDEDKQKHQYGVLLGIYSVSLFPSTVRLKGMFSTEKGQSMYIVFRRLTLGTDLGKMARQEQKVVEVATIFKGNGVKVLRTSLEFTT